MFPLRKHLLSSPAGFFFMALAIVTLTGCNRPGADNPEDSGENVQATPPPEKKAPVIVAAEEAAAAQPQRPDYLAPEGTFFLVADLSIEENDSLTGYRAGTKLIRRGETDEYMANGKILKLTEDQVTNDLRMFK